MELLETIVRCKPNDEEVAVDVITTADDFKGEQQVGYFEDMQTAGRGPVGITFSWEFDATSTIHACHICTDHGWKYFARSAAWISTNTTI